MNDRLIAIRREIAALVPNPEAPDFSIACPNPADQECLSRAFMLTTIYPNGAPMFSLDGTMLDEIGERSIFDDVDQ